MLNEGGIRCLPHYLCIIPYPRSDERKVSSSGFFLIDNNFQVIDIDNVVDNDDGGEAQTQDTDFGDIQENHDDNCNEDEDIDDIVIPDRGQRIQSGFPKLELVLDSNSSFLKLYYMN